MRVSGCTEWLTNKCTQGLFPHAVGMWRPATHVLKVEASVAPLSTGWSFHTMMAVLVWARAPVAVALGAADPAASPTAAIITATQVSVIIVLFGSIHMLHALKFMCWFYCFLEGKRSKPSPPIIHGKKQTPYVIQRMPQNSALPYRKGGPRNRTKRKCYLPAIQPAGGGDGQEGEVHNHDDVEPLGKDRGKPRLESRCVSVCAE